MRYRPPTVVQNSWDERRDRRAGSTADRRHLWARRRRERVGGGTGAYMERLDRRRRRRRAGLSSVGRFVTTFVLLFYSNNTFTLHVKTHRRYSGTRIFSGSRGVVDDGAASYRASPPSLGCRVGCRVGREQIPEAHGHGGGAAARDWGQMRPSPFALGAEWLRQTEARFSTSSLRTGVEWS